MTQSLFGIKSDRSGLVQFHLPRLKSFQPRSSTEQYTYGLHDSRRVWMAYNILGWYIILFLIYLNSAIKLVICSSEKACSVIIQSQSL
jgi:hypothetical protein